MQRLAVLSIALLMFGCAGPRQVSFELAEADAGPLIVDKRHDSEKSYENCSNVSSWMFGVPDDSFKTSRLDLLRTRLWAAFGDQIKEVTVHHFQNCLPDIGGFAPATVGVSYAAAILADGIASHARPEIITYIDVTIDGVHLSAADRKPYSARWERMFPSERAVGLVASSSEDAVAQLVANIRAHLRASNRQGPQ